MVTIRWRNINLIAVNLKKNSINSRCFSFYNMLHKGHHHDQNRITSDLPEGRMFQ